MDETTFGMRLAKLRGLAGISARRLSGLAGVAPTLAGKIEAGHRPDPASSTAVAFAGVLGCTTDWLLSGVGEEPTEADVRAAVERASENLPQIEDAG